MHRRINTAVFLISMTAISTCAVAAGSDGNPDDCFPTCESFAKTMSHPTMPDEGPSSALASLPLPDACSGKAALAHDVERLNAQIKPVKDLVGYVRSPQGLAVKLVNDHLFKIPAWVGFALDPAGTIKHKAIDQVRSRAKDALLDGEHTCKTETQKQFDLSIDAA